jgi:hypothetical protein
MANAQQVQHHGVTGWTGWVAFASFILAITGIYHIVLGIGGIFGQDWYIYSSGSVWLFDSSTWGWTMLVGGIILTLTAFLLLAGNMFGRVLGAILALGSLFANLAMISQTPAWSIIAIVLDILVIYAITAHGSEMKHLDEGVDY